MMTVRERMEDNLWGCGLQPEDVDQAMPVIIREINNQSPNSMGFEHSDNPNQRTPLKDCWEIDEKFFDENAVEEFFMRTVKSRAFFWCIRKINSMK